MQRNCLWHWLLANFLPNEIGMWEWVHDFHLPLNHLLGLWIKTRFVDDLHSHLLWKIFVAIWKAPRCCCCWWHQRCIYLWKYHQTRIVGKCGSWVTSFIYMYKTSTTYHLYETPRHFVLINKMSFVSKICLYPHSGYERKYHFKVKRQQPCFAFWSFF